jgi:hypothetical protein
MREKKNHHNNILRHKKCQDWNKKRKRKLKDFRSAALCIIGFIFFMVMKSNIQMSLNNDQVQKGSSLGNEAIDDFKTKQSTLKTGFIIRAIKVAYAVSITSCEQDGFLDGAAVLKHSIHLTSIRSNNQSRYDYQMYAIVHPSAISCGESLQRLGYKVLRRDVPVQVKDIQGTFLRNNIERNGCVEILFFLMSFNKVSHLLAHFSDAVVKRNLSS